MEFNRKSILEKIGKLGFCPVENLVYFARQAEKESDRIEATKILYTSLLDKEQEVEPTHGPTIIHTRRPD